MNADEISDDLTAEQPAGQPKRVVTRGRLKAAVLGLADLVQIEQLFQYPSGSGAPHWVAVALVVVRAGVRRWPSSSSK